jgi:hypothetical protein
MHSPPGAAELIESCAKELALNSCKHPKVTAATIGNIQASAPLLTRPNRVHGTVSLMTGPSFFSTKSHR